MTNLLRLRILAPRLHESIMVMSGVDERDAEAERCQFLRKLQGWSDVPLQRQWDDDGVQRLVSIVFLLLQHLLVMLYLHLV